MSLTLETWFRNANQSYPITSWLEGFNPKLFGAGGTASCGGVGGQAPTILMHLFLHTFQKIFQQKKLSTFSYLGHFAVGSCSLFLWSLPGTTMFPNPVTSVTSHANSTPRRVPSYLLLFTYCSYISLDFSQLRICRPLPLNFSLIFMIDTHSAELNEK